MRAPEHPYGPEPDLVSVPGDLPTFVDSLDELHICAFAAAHQHLDPKSLVSQGAKICALLSNELGALPVSTNEFKDALAITPDVGLLHYAKDAAPAIAWAIADLTLVADIDEQLLARRKWEADPAGLFAPFIVNSTLHPTIRSAIISDLADSGDHSRMLAVGFSAYRDLEPFLRASPGSLPPDVRNLGSPEARSIIYGQILRNLGLWSRASNATPQMKRRLTGWLDMNASSFQEAFATGKAVNEAVRGSEYVDVFVLAHLIGCHERFGLKVAAINRIKALAENAIYRRFESVLNRVNAHDAKPPALDFLTFEFETIRILATFSGLEPFRVETTFLALCTDHYWSLVAPELPMFERTRAIALTAVAAIVASQRAEPDLLEVARRCAARLHRTASGGRQLVDVAVRNAALSISGIDVPLF